MGNMTGNYLGFGFMVARVRDLQRAAVVAISEGKQATIVLFAGGEA